MKKKITFLLSICCFSLTAKAQTYEWAKRIGSTEMTTIKNMKTDASGNVFVAGSFRGTLDADPGSGVDLHTSSGGNNSDIFFGKYDTLGNLIWAKSLSGSTDIYTNEEATNIEIDALGNVYIAGTFSKFVDFDPGPANAILYQTYNPSGNNLFVAKYDALGNYVWAKNFGMSAFLGDKVVLTVDNIGNVYLSGFFQGTADFDPNDGIASMTAIGYSDIYLAKYDSSGSYLWAKQMGGAAASAKTLAIQRNTLGNIIIAGNFSAYVDFDPSAATAVLGGSNQGMFFAEYDPSGNYIRAKNIEVSAVNDLALDASNNIYLAGTIYGTVDFDPSDATAEFTSALVSNFFVKYDASGNYMFAKLLYGGGYDASYKPCLSVDSFNNIYVAGEFTGTGDFDPGVGVANLTSPNSNRDIFFGKYDVLGNFVWVNRIGDISEENAFSIQINQANDVNLTGTFGSTVDFDPGSPVHNLTGSGAFIAKYTSGSPLGISDNVTGALALTVAPNPSHGILNVACTEKLIAVKCTNYLGQSIKVNYENNMINIAALAKGVYFFNFTSESGKTNMRRVVKE